MKTVPVSQLSQTDIQIRQLQVFPENWTNSHLYSRYRHSPRPCSGLFIVCTDIRAHFYEEGREPVTARMGDVVFIPAGVHYHAQVFDGINNQIDTYTLNFHMTDDSGEELLLSEHICVLTHREDDLFTIRTAALSGAVHRVGPHSKLKIQAALFHLLDAIVTSTEEQSDIYYPIRIGVETLRNEWNRNRKIEEYAALCGMGTAYFYRCFRRWSGKSPVEYRNEIRLSNAETMLRYTDIRISEISKAVGFTDPFYFSRIFTDSRGLSPRKYRQVFQGSTDASITKEDTP